MSDIVERLRFDSARCELQFSKGVAGNIEEAAEEIERLAERCAAYKGQAEAGAVEIERLRDALRWIAWDVEGREPDLGECMRIAAEALKNGRN